MPTTYCKTAKGLAEIQTRAHKLAPRLRHALILVDGRRTDLELRTLLLQAPDETLAALHEQGFIEVSTDWAAAAPARAQSPAAQDPWFPPAPSAPPARAVFSLAQMRLDAARLLNDQLGPAAETVAMRIERCQTPAELRAALQQAAQAIANTRGRQAAEAYLARFADL